MGSMQTPRIDSTPKSETCCTGESSRRCKRLLRASAALCVVVSVIYSWQPDWLAPVTLVPAWCWLVPAFTLTAWGTCRKYKLWSLVVLMLWASYTVAFVEEARSLMRSRSGPTSDWKSARAEERGIRVVSLNCFAANSRAAEEVAKWEPDIVLLQESPSREHLRHLSQELYGSDGTFLWGGDTSILAHGRIEPGNVDPNSHFVHATATLPNGLKVNIVSVRLSPPVFRLDFWTPGFWNDHRNKRIKHRQQILEVAQRIEGISTPLIAGGDFNAPPADAALDSLRRQLSDTFLAAGHGWGNTGTNGWPLFRVDQIWASAHFHAASVTAQKTIHSDHRMVVCDLILK